MNAVRMSLALLAPAALAFSSTVASADRTWKPDLSCQNGDFVVDRSDYIVRGTPGAVFQVVIRNKAAITELLRQGAFDKSVVNARGEAILTDVIALAPVFGYNGVFIGTSKRFAVGAPYAFVRFYINNLGGGRFQIRFEQGNPYPPAGPQAGDWIFNNCWKK